MMYTSKYRELRLIMQPSNRYLDDKGRVIPLPGKRVEFTNYKYWTDDPELKEWLHKHHLRGIMFDEIKEEEIVAIQKQIAESMTKVTAGPTSTANLPSAITSQEQGVPSRPEDKVLISDDLQQRILQAVDIKIQTALMDIKELLIKSSTREESIKEGKPRKTFKCPYCQEPFRSNFDVGKHKLECPKKPQV